MDNLSSLLTLENMMKRRLSVNRFCTLLVVHHLLITSSSKTQTFRLKRAPLSLMSTKTPLHKVFMLLEMSLTNSLWRLLQSVQVAFSVSVYSTARPTLRCFTRILLLLFSHTHVSVSSAMVKKKPSKNMVKLKLLSIRAISSICSTLQSRFRSKSKNLCSKLFASKDLKTHAPQIISSLLEFKVLDVELMKWCKEWALQWLWAPPSKTLTTQ